MYHLDMKELGREGGVSYRRDVMHHAYHITSLSSQSPLGD